MTILRSIKNNFINLSNQLILNIANVDEILISDKAAGTKYFIGYKNNDIGRPLCIILLQIRGHRKYFENGGKNVFHN